MPHADILDTILNTPTHHSLTASAELGDLFLDQEYRGTSRGRGAWAQKTAAVIDSDGALAEAFANVSVKQTKVAAIAKAARVATVRQAVQFVHSFVASKSAVKFASRDKAAFDKLIAAGRRLASLLAKTPAQMRQDGASKLADYFDPLVVPAWAKQARADFSLVRDLHARMYVGVQAKKASKTAAVADVVKEKELSDAEIKSYVHDLLNEGVEPKKVLDKLAKLADLQLFNKSIATEYLNDHAGTLGLAYIEPNAFMNDCEATAARVDTKLGKVRAKSVKQIAACTGCVNFKQTAGMKTCTLYRLPVVASNAELFPIVNNLTPGVPTKHKKAALVAIANKETIHDGGKVRVGQVSSAFARTGAKGTVMVNQANSVDTDFGKKASKSAAASFDAKAVLAMHNAGEPLNKIFAHGSKIAGVRQAKKACREFVSSLKGSKTKVALTQIDCSLLGAKLGSSNAIYGAKKCASCTYRKGMHCGLTGGTLVSFPGIEKQRTSRVASTAQDGLSLAKEFDMTGPKMPDDIEFMGPMDSAVELNGISPMDI